MRAHLAPFLSLAGCPGFGSEASNGVLLEVPDEPNYVDHVKLVLDAKCIVCHTEPPQGGAPDVFRLDMYEAPDEDEGGAFDKADRIVARAADERTMPKGGPPLADIDAETLRKWFEDGAPFDSSGSSGGGGGDDSGGGEDDSGQRDTAGDDADGDGFATPEDCDDGDASVNPGATEVCDGLDDDCDGSIDEGVTTTYYLDGDGDGFGLDAETQEACTQPAGFASQGGDCDDGDSASNPDAGEVCDDGVDNDCDGSIDEYPPC